VTLGIVVGLRAEARLARRLPGRVAIGGGTRAGARQAAERLVAEGATALLSFGLAGGLDPALGAGAILTPGLVLSGDERLVADARLIALLGGTPAGSLLDVMAVVADATAKRRLRRESGAAAVDLESGPVALAAEAHGLPFAVLRAICDPAQRTLPPAALAALDAGGGIAPWRVLASLARHPGQLPTLLALARDAAAARAALAAHLARLPGAQAS
jgi:adenosylhomocysteine nucleosidase